VLEHRRGRPVGGDAEHPVVVHVGQPQRAVVPAGALAEGQPVEEHRGRHGVHRCRGTVAYAAAVKADGDTKERLVRAGEHLFARHGIHRVRLREINDLAGQRNPSALHYHFGTRDGLVQAILSAHQEPVDEALGQRLDELEQLGEVTTRDVVAAAVLPLARELDTPSGRDFLRIVPQTIDLLSTNLRQGVAAPSTPQTRRILVLLEARLAPLPPAVRRERLVTYALLLTATLADRARQLESGEAPALDDRQFVAHLLDAIVGALDAPSTVAPRRRSAARRA
jgi:AcrR family transcriptional regulator